MKIDIDKLIWKGKTVSDFIEELEPLLDLLIEEELFFIRNKHELKEWCINNQQEYQKEIPEITSYFLQKYNIEK